MERNNATKVQAEMSEISSAIPWKKNHPKGAEANQRARLPYLLGLALIILALAYLWISSNLIGGQYFVTVQDLQTDASYLGKPAQVIGAVIGSSIEYDVEQLSLRFTIAHMPVRSEDLARAIFEAANDPERAQLTILLEGEVMPAQLQDHAQAIVSGNLAPDGIFHATQLQFKCPTRFGDLPEHEDLLPLG